MNITLNGKRHLGAVIGSQEYRDEYVIIKTDQIANELNNLCEIAKLVVLHTADLLVVLNIN